MADFQAFFDAAPGAMAVLRPDDPVFTIVAANDAYVQTGGVARADLLGRGLFEVFPDSSASSGAASLLDSLQRAIANRAPDLLNEQRYDIEREGIFQQRYWNVRHIPLFDSSGCIEYILNCPEEVTDRVLAQIRFRQLAEGSALGIALGSAATGISYVNDALERMLGYSAADAPEDLLYAGEKVLTAKNGRRIPALVSLSRLDSVEGGDELAAFVLDLTARKLSEGDAFLVRLDDAMRPLVDSDAITLTAARMLGEYLNVNRCAYADVEEDEDTFNLTGDFNRGVDSIVGRYKFTQFGVECLRLMRAGEPYVVTDSESDPRVSEDVLESYRATRIRSVICVPLRKAGRFVAAMAVHQITARNWQAEEVDLMRLVASRCWESIERSRVTRELQSSEWRLRLAQRASRIGTFDWLIQENRIVWTPELEELYGLPEGSFAGRIEAWEECVLPEDAARVLTLIGNCFPERRTDLTYEFRAVLPDGRHRWLRGVAQFHYLPDGRPQRMIGVNIDIDAEKHAEAELRHQWKTFDTALSHTPDFTYTFDLKGRFTYVNRALLSLWQKRLGEAVGRSFFELGYPPELAERLQFQIAEVIATRQPVRDRTPFTGPTGETRYYEYIFVPVLADDGSAESVAGSTRDITEQKKAEELVIEDRRRWRELLLQAPAAMVVLRGPEHRIEAVNVEYERLVGRSAEALIGKTIAEALPELAGQVYIGLLNDVYRTGESFTGHEALARLSGKDFYVNFVYLATRSVSGEIDGIFAHVVDVTGMVLARREVEASEKRFRTLIDSARDHAIIGLDLQGCVTNWNQGAERLLGYTEAEIAGKPGAIIFTAEDRERDVPRQELHKAIDEGEGVDERWHVRKDGSRFWGSGTATPVRGDDGSAVGFVKVFQDRSREWEARQTLRESEERFRRLANSMPQMVWTAQADGVFDYFNERWYEFTGFDPADGQIQRWNLLLHPEDRERYGTAWAHSIRSGEPHQFEYRLWDRREERWRWFLGRAAPARDDTGAIVKWFGAITDIDEQKTAQQAVLQAQKLESIGLLAGGIAHDFNNLLVAIMGGASFALETIPSSHPSYAMLQGVVDASERAAHLTRQMLAYAGKGKFVIEAVNLSDMVVHTAALVTASIPKSVQVKLQLDEHLPAVLSDQGQMQQVTMNLIINAAEAVGETNGFVVVRTRAERISEDQRRRDVAGNIIAPGFYAVLEVQDTGCGIDSATLTKIFDPFFTTKFTGRGLGLAAVMGVVLSHRGAIEVDTTPGEGSIFRVFLPADAGAAVKPSSPSGMGDVKGRGTVLVIDDEAMVRLVAKAALERAGYAVIMAEDGQRGVDCIRDNRDVSLVLLDMSMPGMSGRSVLEQLKTVRPKLPVVICSGFSEDEVYRKFAGLDMAGVLPKPFTTSTLAAKVKAVLERVN